jgi:CubicO group peptidase (beta-lactamase class C family)
MASVPAETMARVRQGLERRAAAGDAAGLVALVGHGEACEVACVGATAFGGAEPIGRDALFRIASMTKPITAAATMMLVEDGALSLNEPVDRWLPELANRQALRRLDGPLDDTLPATRPITVDDLLTFRCGLGIVFGSPDKLPILAAIAERDLVGFGPPRPQAPYGPDEWLRRLGELPLMAQPGERWLYSTGSNVLGALIARASGQSLSDFLQRRLFEPLGMQDTGFFATPEKVSRLPVAYWTTPDGPKAYDAPPESDWATPPPFPAGDSGLVSTVDDMFGFSRFMLSGGLAGGRRLLSEASIEAMTSDHLTPAQRAEAGPILDAGQGWGYGVSVHLERAAGGPPIGAYGWTGGLGSSWVADPGGDMTAILMTQSAFGGPTAFAAHTEFWEAVFGAERLQDQTPA